jgi:Tol biopolymer transport system component
MRRPNDFLGDLTGRLHIDFLDLLPAFQAAPESPFFDYDEHMSPVGHALMAAALGDRLEDISGQPDVRLLSADFMADRYPTLSQDGSLMGYQSFRDGNMELFVASADLRERQQLTFNDVDESHPMLSKDNSQILFTQGSPESQRTEVVLMNVDGSHRKILTPEANVFGAIPAFSKSNLHIAYAEWTFSEASRTFSLPRIVVLDVLSGKKRNVTPSDREAWRPVFAPDGASIYYISKTRDQFDLYAYDLTTGIERQLTQTSFDEWDPQVSSDGSHLVYSGRADGNWDLFLLELATSSTRRLTKTKGDEWDPFIAPDRPLILFAGRFGLLEAIFEMPFPN